MDTPTLSILVPVYNEKNRARQAIDILYQSKFPWPWEIIVVDDGSTDGTSEILQDIAKTRPDMRLFRLPKNMGKGAAVRAAIEKARGKFCVVQDADLEYNPVDIPLVVEPLIHDGADIVCGSRFWGWRKRRVLLFWHAMGNQVITFFVNMLADLNLTDVEGGYKAFRTEIFKNLRLESNGFEIEVEIIIKGARMRCVFYEVPISYHGRTYAEGKKITWKDGVKALTTSIHYRFSHPKPPPIR